MDIFERQCLFFMANRLLITSKHHTENFLHSAIYGDIREILIDSRKHSVHIESIHSFYILITVSSPLLSPYSPIYLPLSMHLSTNKNEKKS